MPAFHDIAPLLADSTRDHAGFWWFPFTSLWVVVLGTAIWFVVRTRRHGARSGFEQATEILAERYARGELSTEEYRERLDELRGRQ
jgi:putative membrane protein